MIDNISMVLTDGMLCQKIQLTQCDRGNFHILSLLLRGPMQLHVEWILTIRVKNHEQPVCTCFQN